MHDDSMKKVFGIIFCCFVSIAQGQTNLKPTDSFTITGAVKQETKFSLKDYASYKQSTLDSFVVYNHLMERKRTVNHITGISLKEVLSKVGLNVSNPKLYSEFYFTCIASDGYKVVFSWNELFNTPVGEEVLIVTASDGTTADKREDRIAIVSPADKATGRRYLKNLETIRVERAQ